MPLRDVEAMNADLDSNYDGVDIEVALFVGNPAAGGVEANPTNCPGYVRFASPDTDREVAADGAKKLCDATFDASAAWTDDIDYVQVFIGSVGWDYMPLDAFDVPGAGTISKPVIVFWGDAVEEA